MAPLLFTQMVGYYITLRTRQLWRFFVVNSIHPLVGLGLLAAAWLGLSAIVFYKLPQVYAAPVYGGMALAVVIQLQNKASNDLLAHSTDKITFFKAKLAEHLLVVLPFVLFLLYKQEWLYAGAVALAVIPYSYYSFAMPRPRITQLPTPYPAHSFEFLYGFRTYFVVYLVHVGLLLLGIVAVNYYICIAAFFVLLFVMCSYYGLVEDDFYIWIHRSTASAFLWQKIKTLSLSYTITFASFMVVSLLFFQTEMALGITCICVGLLALTGSMLIKYHFYPSAFIIQLSQMIFFGFAMASIVSPPSIIIVIAYLVFTFIKARKRLQTTLQC